MTSRFRMQIIDTLTGEVVQWQPGYPIETELVSDCVNKIVHLAGDNPITPQLIATGIEDAIYLLKSKVHRTPHGG